MSKESKKSKGRGGARQGAGRPKVPTEMKVLKGSYRTDRDPSLPKKSKPQSSFICAQTWHELKYGHTSPGELERIFAERGDVHLRDCDCQMCLEDWQIYQDKVCDPYGRVYQ